MKFTIALPIASLLACIAASPVPQHGGPQDMPPFVLDSDDCFIIAQPTNSPAIYYCVSSDSRVPYQAHGRKGQMLFGNLVWDICGNDHVCWNVYYASKSEKGYAKN